VKREKDQRGGGGGGGKGTMGKWKEDQEGLK